MTSASKSTLFILSAGLMVAFQNCSPANFSNNADSVTQAASTTGTGGPMQPPPPRSGPGSSPMPTPVPPSEPTPAATPVPTPTPARTETSMPGVPRETSDFVARCRANWMPIALPKASDVAGLQNVNLTGTLVRTRVAAAKAVSINDAIAIDVKVLAAESLSVRNVGGAVSAVAREVNSIERLGGILQVASARMGNISNVGGFIAASTERLSGNLEELATFACVRAGEIDPTVEVKHNGGLVMLSGGENLMAPRVSLKKINDFGGVLILENMDVESVSSGGGAIVLINSRIRQIDNYAATVYMRDSQIDSSAMSAQLRRVQF